MLRRCHSWEEIYFYQSYLEYRIMHEPPNGNQFLNDVRNVAVQISTLGGVHKVKESSIADVVHTFLYAETWASRWVREGWKNAFYRPLKWDAAETDKQLFGAALCTNALWYVRRSTALRDAILSNPKSPENSCLFGSYVDLAAKFGNEELLKYLMTSEASDLGPDLRFQLFESAAKGTRVETVRFLYDFRNEDWSWRFEDSFDSDGSALNKILRSVRDPQVWDFIDTLRIACGMPSARRKAVYEQISHYAGLGWLGMVSHLIRIGARTDEDRHNWSICMCSLSDYDLSCMRRNEAVNLASEKGFVSIVELLLDDGVESDQTFASAARRGQRNVLELLLGRGIKVSDALADVGTYPTKCVVPAKLLARTVTGPYLDVVRLLLDAGVDVNESIGKESPLAGAIATEHPALFEFLLQRGADLHSPGTAEECVRRAKKDGLESMLSLLEKHGVDVNVPLEEAT
jgi:hypothetical protein